MDHRSREPFSNPSRVPEVTPSSSQLPPRRSSRVGVRNVDLHDPFPFDPEFERERRTKHALSGWNPVYQNTSPNSAQVNGGQPYEFQSRNPSTNGVVEVAGQRYQYYPNRPAFWEGTSVNQAIRLESQQKRIQHLEQHLELLEAQQRDTSMRHHRCGLSELLDQQNNEMSEIVQQQSHAIARLSWESSRNAGVIEDLVKENQMLKKEIRSTDVEHWEEMQEFEALPGHLRQAWRTIRAQQQEIEALKLELARCREENESRSLDS